MAHRADVRQAQSIAGKATARTRETLWITVGQLLDAFTPDEGRNYLEHAGYAFD